MTSRTLLLVLAATLRSRGDVLPAPVAAQVTDKQIVYVVTRCAGAESRALFSSRLVRLKAENLHWYDDANVVRAELPAESLAELREDPEVLLALPEQSPSEPAAPQPPPPSAMTPPPAPPPPGMPPAMALAMAPGPAMPAPPMMAPPAGLAPGAMSIGMGGVTPLGIVDSLAGMVVARLMNPPPSCRIAVAKLRETFPAGGGDEVIEVKASGSCSWQAQSSVPWIKITSGTGGSGSGIVSYSVGPYEGKRRTGSISIMGAAGGSPIKGSAIVVVSQSPMVDAAGAKYH